MKRDMTEYLTEEGEGRIFQWSRISEADLSRSGTEWSDQKNL